MHALDNPIWTALTTKQATLAHTSALARRFSPEMTLLGAVAANTAMAFDSLAQLIQRDPVTLYFSAPQNFAGKWEVVRAVELHQMVQENPGAIVDQDSAKHEVVELTINAGLLIAAACLIGNAIHIWIAQALAARRRSKVM